MVKGLASLDRSLRAVSVASSISIIDYITPCLCAIFSFPPCISMVSSQSGRLADSVCSAFLDALVSLPSTWTKSKISLNDVETAAASLEWSISPSSLAGPSEDLNTTDLMALSFAHLQLSDSSASSLVVETYSAHQWSSTSKREGDHSVSEPPNRKLPDGLAELLSQIERAYSNNPGRLSPDEVVAAISKSEHLVALFPHIVRFAVERVRVDSRSQDITLLLHLVKAIVGNARYVVSSQGEFEIILNGLIEVIVDCNLVSGLSARRQAVAILSLLLEMKVGRFHSVSLVSDLVRDVFLLFVSEIVALKTVPDACIVSGLAGAVLAVHTLRGATALAASAPALRKFVKTASGIAPEACALISECITIV